MVNARKLAEERYSEKLRKEREYNEHVVKLHFDKVRAEVENTNEKSEKRAR